MLVVSGRSTHCLRAFPMEICPASLDAVLVHRAILSPLFLTETTAPQISSLSANCSPIIASSRLSQDASVLLLLVALEYVTVHFPPFAHMGSSHFGSIPSLKTWRSAPVTSLEGGTTLLYRHQKSSTVLKVYTLLRVWPHVVCFCFPFGLSNQKVQECSRGCFLVRSKVTSFLLLPEEGALMDRSVGFFTAAIVVTGSFYFYLVLRPGTHSSRVDLHC
mmetsp:Transcript_8808/g.30262  ORF Transcript_8808/g.30262 Transcript_8808/m.30262 type:complete len:218 (-) Transcript_8808:75-728(-)